MSNESPSNKIDNNDGDKKPANQNPCDESDTHPQNEITPANGDKGLKTKPLVLALTIVDAGLCWLFYGFSDFFGGFGHPSLSLLCFYFFVVALLGVMSIAVYKQWQSLRVIVPTWLFLSVLLGVSIYIFSQHKATNSGVLTKTDIEAIRNILPTNTVRQTNFVRVENVVGYFTDSSGNIIATNFEIAAPIDTNQESTIFAWSNMVPNLVK